MSSIARTFVLFALLYTVFSALSQAVAENQEEIWIDVRSPQEYIEGHREGAVNIPYMQIMRQISDITPDKSANIRLYCTAGVRAAIAKQILDSMGYESVVNEGGLENIKQ